MKPTRSYCACSIHDFKTYHCRHVVVTTNVELIMMMMVLMVESDRISKTKIIWQVPRVSVFVDQMLLGTYLEDKFLLSIKASPSTFK